tara:strand:+ start:427 stop:3288 length:2862 start_codon:yes stop_codon:yes gene_type:complete
MGFEVIVGLGLAGLAWNLLKGSISHEAKFDEALYKKEINKRKQDEEKKLPLLKQYKSFFDNLFKYSLSKEQRLAIVDDANASLAIASAGSGKTSILKAKYAFLIESGQATQQEILVMAFNRKVKEEIVNDLENMGFSNPNVETFHSFGKSISEMKGEKFTIDPLASEDKHKLINTQLIDTLLTIAEEEDKQIRSRLREFKLLCPCHSIFSLAKDEIEYKQAMQDYPYKRDPFKDTDYERPLRIPAIDGKTFVKSQEELLIINYLIACGIEVEYEKKFPNAEFDYRPDFYLPIADLWWEHFGIDKKGESPFGKEYIKEYKNKKNLHERLYTNHFFTYSYNVQENKIISLINEMLKKQGINISYISQEKIDANIQKFYSDTVNSLIAQSIRQAKANQYSIKEIEQRYEGLKDQFRASKFSKIFIPFYKAYKEYLVRNGTNDFEDMILNATSVLLDPSTTIPSRYKFILVDEFQDLSISRERLLESIITYNDESKLFAVGDDWQSIYRFTGSDIGAVTRFEEKFPMLKDAAKGRDFAVNLIKRTYRFEDSIAKVSANFIQKNPNQVPKITQGNDNNDGISFEFFDVEEYSTKYMLKILNHIPKSPNKKSVYFLARANFSINSVISEMTTYDSVEKKIDWKEIQKSRPDLEIQWNTIHSAKGLEKDIVIILGNDSGSRGFPNWWGEDPLFSIFLPQDDNYLYAEERRVMYVAMTRTKSSNFFVHKDHKPSIFVDEIKDICNSLKIEYKEYTYRDNRIKPCPECLKFGRTGWLSIKTSNPNRPKSQGYFNVRLACNLYNPVYKNSENFCNYFEDDAICPECISKGHESNIYVKDEGPEAKIFCKNQDCSFEEDYYQYHSNKGLKDNKPSRNSEYKSQKNKAHNNKNITKTNKNHIRVLDDNMARSIKLGSSVKHPAFGLGSIKSFDFSRELGRVEVYFQENSQAKWLVISYAKLQIIS